MLSTVLDTFKETIAAHVWSGTGESVKVVYIDLKNKEESLVPDAINLSLFTSTEMKSIIGAPSYRPPTIDNNVTVTTEQKPPLKLCLNVLLIFNLNDYINAIDCYQQVLGYFYNNDILPVQHNGHDNPINVLTSGFNDHNEIEIRNSFNVPGVPLLRYDLFYALVDGDMRRLPAVTNVGLAADVDNPDEILDASLVYIIADPVEKATQFIQQRTNRLSALESDDDSSKYFGIIKSKYERLIEQYAISHDKIDKVSALSEARPYLFALTAFQPLLLNHQETLVKHWTDLSLSSSSSIAALQTGHQQLSSIANQQAKTNHTNFKTFMDKCRVASTYLPITQNIMASVEQFDALGKSIYKSVARGFKTRSDITITQQKQKWWTLEERLSALITQYQSTLAHELLDVDEPAYVNFKDQISDLKGTLAPHLTEITKLNKRHNAIDGDVQDIDPVIEQSYTTCYTDAHRSVHFPEGTEGRSISHHLESILATFLITITTK